MPADQKFLDKVQLVIEKRLDDERFNIAQLCRELGISRAQLYRQLEALQQPPPNALILAARLRRAESLLRQARLAISEAAYRAGFSSPAYFTLCFRKAYGMAPSQYRKQFLKQP